MMKFLKGLGIGFLVLIAIMIATGNAVGAAHFTKQVGHDLSVAAQRVGDYVSNL